jgi:anti-sigma regulatory factor (Ser/Thr protein kinase)
MQAMLRVAFRLGASLDTAFVNVNNQLEETLPDDRFITAFVGLVDRRAHRVRYHSGGQAPILFYEAASKRCVSHGPTSFPLAAMQIETLRRAATKISMMPGDILVLVSDGVFECCSPGGEEFGAERVRVLVEAHHAKPMAELAGLLFEAVGRFTAAGAPEDDMTVVFVKRDPWMSVASEFRRSFEAIDDLVAFTAEAFAAKRIPDELRPSVDLVLEELFTNVVKYGHPTDVPVRVELTRIAGGVEVTVAVEDADDFDVTRAGPVDVNAPIESRTPGGLGLHLVRKLVDSIQYRYEKETRQGLITFRKTVAAPQGEDNDASD